MPGGRLAGRLATPSPEETIGPQLPVVSIQRAPGGALEVILEKVAIMTQFRTASAWLLLLVAFAGGCSKPAPSDVTVASSVPASEVRPPLDTAAGSTTPAETNTANDLQAEGEDTFIPPFPENVDYFSPPEVVFPLVPDEPEAEVAEPEPEPVAEVQQEDRVPASNPPPPPLRLVGFVEVDGLKALLSVDGKMTVTTIGDSVGGLEVLAVEPPAVVLKHGEEEICMNMFEQEWVHKPVTRGPLFGSGSNRGGSPARTTRPQGRRLPGADASMPTVPGQSELGEPMTPDLPEVGEPETDLPELPRLPLLLGVEGQGEDDVDDVFDPMPGFAGR
jgi:hypothetical protein